VSGGSFDYLFLANSFEDAVANKREELHAMREVLEEIAPNHPVTRLTAAADDGGRVSLPDEVERVWHAVEWWKSGDWSFEQVQTHLDATSTYVGAIHSDHERLLKIERNLHELLGAYEASGILSASRVRKAMDV
jgi:hypothetical protein